MNWLNVFQKPSRLTKNVNQMDKLTLDSAREQIATQATEIQGLQVRIAEFETNAATATAELAQLRTDIESLRAENLTLANDKATLTESSGKLSVELVAAQAQVAELQKKDMNADMRAAERLASISGKPLAIAGNQEPNLSLVDISLAMDAANVKGDKAEVARLGKLYDKTKAGK
jgi:chromosome segregation ATPase